MVDVTFEFLPTRVEVTLRIRKDTGFVRDDEYVTVAADGNGYIDVVGKVDDFDDKVEWLIDHEVAERVTVSPEGDTELRLTDAWRQRLHAHLSPLARQARRGWIDVPDA